RLFNGPRRLVHDLIHQLRILHQRRSLAVFHNLRHRAAHIDIQDLERQFLDRLRLLADDLRIRAKQLQRHRILSGINGQQRLCISIFILQCLRTDHLHTQKSRSLLLAEQPERAVSHSRHRSENVWIRKFYVSYLHLGTPLVTIGDVLQRHRLTFLVSFYFLFFSLILRIPFSVSCGSYTSTISVSAKIILPRPPVATTFASV